MYLCCLCPLRLTYSLEYLTDGAGIGVRQEESPTLGLQGRDKVEEQDDWQQCRIEEPWLERFSQIMEVSGGTEFMEKGPVHLLQT